MSFTRDIQKKGEILIVRYKGEYSDQNLEQSEPAFEAFAKQCHQEGCNKVLVDARNLSVHLSSISLFEIAKQLAAPSTRTTKFALMTPEPDEFFENVAVNRGANMRLFTDEEDAISWLAGANPS